jgi:hypothetical protein
MTSRTRDRVRCKAHSSRTGAPCQAWAVRGASVCVKHGGAAPQVKRKAEERIRELVNPALAAIARLIGETEDHVGAESEAVKLAAARDILDRAGYSPTAKIHLEGDLTVKSPIDIEMEQIAQQLREQAEREEQAT